ncbi:metallophosphoesterase [Deinococcus hopiensis]|uniref:Calcineurin-like phosphoesterase domain-containing protein n=1 Tax=Deinococcus hopiensis KR-140 TaxID=695939 RepID=A0A1W1UGY2_9DEIO|nr:metallophosphoesterase [Deinococcus hopiensis]SMB80337.1 hypothetical protein SAMN00790413_05497 [Deinococcus hopiensis KR-140]
MQISRRAVLLGGLGLGSLGATGLNGAYAFEINHHVYALPGLQSPIRAVQLTDLHYGPFHRAAAVRAWMETALTLRPDLVLITGDFADRHLLDAPGPLFQELSRLRAPLGVWGVWGNHDHDYCHREAQKTGRDPQQARDAFTVALKNAGIGLLRNGGLPLRDDLYLAGVDDLRKGDPQLTPALMGAPTQGAVLLMSHNPDLLPTVPSRVSLTLCGHTHGGQVRLPGIGAPVPASRFGQRFVQGFVQGPAPGFVSRGLGTTGIPVRLHCPAELVVFDFVPG